MQQDHGAVPGRGTGDDGGKRLCLLLGERQRDGGQDDVIGKGIAFDNAVLDDHKALLLQGVDDGRGDGALETEFRHEASPPAQQRFEHPALAFGEALAGIALVTVRGQAGVGTPTALHPPGTHHRRQHGPDGVLTRTAVVARDPVRQAQQVGGDLLVFPGDRGKRLEPRRGDR